MGWCWVSREGFACSLQGHPLRYGWVAGSGLRVPGQPLGSSCVLPGLSSKRPLHEARLWRRQSFQTQSTYRTPDPVTAKQLERLQFSSQRCSTQILESRSRNHCIHIPKTPCGRMASNIVARDLVSVVAARATHVVQSCRKWRLFLMEGKLWC